MSIIKEKKYDESGFPSPASSAEDLDQYGVWVKAGPETIEDESPDLDELELSDLSDIDTEITSEEEALLGTLEEKGETAEGELSLEGLEDFSFPEPADVSEEETLSAPEELPETARGAGSGKDEAESLDIDFNLEEEKLEAELPAAEEEGASVDFNDLEAVELDMSEPVPSSPKSGGVAGDILTKIELELASIKEELAELKRELSILKPASAAEPQDRSSVSPETPAEEVGFFEEDEDETIALTGDELDNILNTADITEEKGESDILPEDMEIDLHKDDDIISLEEPGEETAAAAAPAAETEARPSTTPEEMAIIEEYNRELDNFGAEEFHIDAEDALDSGAVAKLPGDDDTLEELQPEEAPAGQEGVEFDLEALNEPEILEEVEAPEAEIIAPAEELLEMPELPEVVEAETEAIPVFEEELPALEEISSDETEEVPAVLEEESVIPDLDLAEEAVEVSPIPPLMEEETPVPASAPPAGGSGIPENLKEEVKSVLKYMDQLLEALPEEKIQEFAHSEHFEVYRKLFEELGLE